MAIDAMNCEYLTTTWISISGVWRDKNALVWGDPDKMFSWDKVWGLAAKLNDIFYSF